MASRYRLVAAAITAIFIASACSGATPSSAPASVAPAPSASAAVAPSASAAGQDFTGVTVELLTFNGPQIAEPLQRRAPDFEALTGAKINVVAVGFQEIYDKAILDLSTGTNSFDAFVFNPQWLGDFTGPGYLEDLSARVESDPVVDWQDVGPFFRDFNATYGGKTYTIPLDGDFHMVYYRSDLIDTPPKTWDEYLTVAAAHHGKDLNGDGEPDYGSCIAKKKGQQSFWWIISVAGGLLQSKGTGEGAFFDTTTMQPLLQNEAFAKALDTYKKTMDFGPPDEINLGVGDTRGLFTTGRCALSMDWGDIGTLALDPATSTVQDKVGAVITPGWTETLDRATGQARRLRCDDLPERGRWRQLRPLRIVRWLVRRDQRGGSTGEEGRGLRVPRLHERPCPVERGRDPRQDGLQSVPDRALRGSRSVDGSRDEHGRPGPVPRRDRGQPPEPEHGPRHAHPQDEGVRAGRPRHGRLAVHCR